VVWGITGALLSTPLTVITMAILAEFTATRPLAVLLSGDGKPYADLEGETHHHHHASGGHSPS
jgi:hypothetical protein